MIRVEMIRETRDSEEHRVLVNSKSFELTIEKSPEGPVFRFHDEGIQLEPHEQIAVLAEIQQISVDFSARRVFGTFVPASTRKSFKKK
jgi:hypothetical protein